MPDYLLYHMPGSCSRVVRNALEETGLPYRESGIALMRGAHREAAYLAINPKGKVPVLVCDGLVMTVVWRGLVRHGYYCGDMSHGNPC